MIKIEKLLKEKNGRFVDIFSKILGSDGQPINAGFTKHSLHMNTGRYAIW